jgi:rhamnose utilization protein RhaD (predicted bifunctional aldolase and dehydrogenase)
MNHGIFTFGNNAKEAYDLMIRYVSQAERVIKKLKVKKINQIKNFSAKFNPHEVAPIIRGLLSNNKDQKFVVNYRLNKRLKYFINGKNVRSYSSKGTATPDHVIRVKPFPLIITPKKNSSVGEFKTTAKKAFENYRKKYINYFNINKNKVKG